MSKTMQMQKLDRQALERELMKWLKERRSKPRWKFWAALGVGVLLGQAGPAGFLIGAGVVLGNFWWDRSNKVMKEETWELQEPEEPEESEWGEL